MSYNKTIGVFCLVKRINQQFEKDVHLSSASVNITVLWLTDPDVNLKRMHQLYKIGITHVFLVH